MGSLAPGGHGYLIEKPAGVYFLRACVRAHCESDGAGPKFIWVVRQTGVLGGARLLVLEVTRENILRSLRGL